MKLNNQPVKPVRVPPTRFDRVLDLVALFLIVLLWVLTIKFYIDAPERVPIGFDAAGNPRGWGSAAFYFLMSGMGTFYAVAMFFAAYFPQFINIPVVLKESTIVPQSALMIRCCRWLNIVGLAMFLFILFHMAGYQYEALRMDASLFVAGMIGNVVLMLGFIIYYSVRISQVK
ncbi:MAG: DUF1648 domain-containing protein [Bacteroidaceae bacterium]|nr:DUF1648 domain-containing protein [Bacteroidaceae bacterium]